MVRGFLLDVNRNENMTTKNIRSTGSKGRKVIERWV